MSTKVLLKKSSVAGKVPSSADLSYGEVALNYADGKIYYKDSSNTIKSFSAVPQLSVNDLTDVDTTSTTPTVGQVLKWNGTNWAPGDDATVGGSGTDADTLDGFDSSYFLNYNNLSNKPTLFSGSYSDLTNRPTLFSGSYNDLTNRPTLFSGDYNDLTNTPSLSTVATSGSYNDLSNLPTLVKAAVQWTANHTLADGTRYLVGDVVYDNGNIFVANFDNESIPTSSSLYWTNLGAGNRLNIDGRDIPNITYNQLIGKPMIPAATGDLVNDAGFITSAALTGYATETYVNSQITNVINGAPGALDTLQELAAALGNDSSFATTITNQLALKVNSSALATVATSGSYADLTNKPNLFSGSYDDLTGKPNLFSGSYTDLTNKPSLSTVATSGSYTDLTNKPTLFSGAYDDLTGKPVLFSGSYNDLTNKPVLFSGSYTDLTNKPVLFSGSYNDLTNKPTIPTVPTNVSAFTNDANYATVAQVNSTNSDAFFYASQRQAQLVSGTNIKTINGQSLLGSGDITISGGISLTNLSVVRNSPGSAANLTYNSSTGVFTFTPDGMFLKQDTLVSGTNIKTINGQSLLGSGNITITGGGIALTDLAVFTASSGQSQPSGSLIYNNQTGIFQFNPVDLASKQNTLVSGTNIKTINGQSLLGSGNITITGGGGGGATTLDELTDVDTSTNTPANGQALVYSASTQKWIPQTISGGSGGSLYTNTATLTTTASNQTVDSFNITEYRTVKYILQAIAGADVHSTEITVIHNDTNVFINEYGIIYTSSSPLITVSAEIDLNNVYLKVTPSNANTVIDLTRISIVARTIGSSNPLLLLNDLETQTFPTIDLQTDNYPDRDLNI